MSKTVEDSMAELEEFASKLSDPAIQEALMKMKEEDFVPLKDILEEEMQSKEFTHYFDEETQKEEYI